jgi:hypothetical protein
MDRIAFTSPEDVLQNKNYKLHRSEVVVVQQHFVQRWTPQPGLTLGFDRH